MRLSETTLRVLRGASLSLAITTLPLVAAAQEEDEDVLILSPFEVNASRDVGYLSTNATSGTSLNTEIKNLPMTVQVVNQEFINDLGATDMAEALEYTAGVYTTEQQASTDVGSTRATGDDDRSVSSAADGDRFANVTYIRGLSVPFQNRMGFRYGGIVVTPDSAIALGGLLDSSNIERMEVVRGPNSLLYGVGVLTGIVNVIPERPLYDPFYEASVKAGSNDFLRFTADITGPIFEEGETFIPGQMAYRVAGARERRGHWTEYREQEVDYWVVQLEHRYKDKTRLFLEYQDGVTRFEGIGSQFIYDEVNSARDTEFRNEWDEAYAWARHEGTIERLRPLDPGSFNGSVDTTVGPQAGFQLVDQPFVGGGKPDHFRITGPDTYAERDEWNFIADFELFPVENLTLNAGVFISEQETEELDLDIGSFTTSNPNLFQRDEVVFDQQLNQIWLNNGVYGVPMQEVVEESVGIDIRPVEGVEGDWIFPALNDDIKLTEYYWERSLVKSRSTQFRLRGTYTLNTPFLFDTEAEHTFLIGFHYINDDVDFPNGSLSSQVQAQANPSGLDRLDPEDREEYTQLRSNDGLYYRSIANFEPFHLDGRNGFVEGHNTVRAGDVYLNQDIQQEGYYGVYHGKFLEDERFEIILGVRRDIYNAEQYMYQRIDRWFNEESGQFEPLTADVIRQQADASILAQVNTETATRFNVTEEEVAAGEVPGEVLAFRDDLLQRRTETGQYISNWYEEQEGLGYFKGDRGGPVDEFHGIVPGSQRDIFEEDIEVDTFTVGVNFDITDDLTIYGLLSEGLTPNTALRDGQGNVIDAETTNNKEVGLKFDFLDGKISGAVAFFEIERENAIWEVDIAPAASKWFDAQLEPGRSREWDTPTYDPDSPAAYYVRSEYVAGYIAEILEVDPALIKFAGFQPSAEAGRTIQQTLDPDDLPDDLSLGEKLVLINDIQNNTIFPEEMIAGIELTQQFGGNVSVNNIGVEPGALDELYEVTLYNPDTGEFVTRQVSANAILYNAFTEREIDKTKNDFLQNNHPIRYRNFSNPQPQPNNQVDLGNAHGALVTFDETIRGMEVDTIFTINENIQFLVQYSHIEREADDTFDFTPWRSIEDQEHPFVPPYTMLHREYGWAQAGIDAVWVDAAAYQEIAAGGEVVSRDQIEGAIVEEIENPDETIPVDVMAQRNMQGQSLIFIDKRGEVINEANTAEATDYDQVLEGVSLNFNPEDEVAVWSKYTFTDGPLDNLSLNLGVKWVGESRTSVAFNSVSPLNPLTVTPEVDSYYKFDGAISYTWEWNDFDFRLAFNVYNIFDHTYDVTTTTLGIPNPITGEPVHKRTEEWYAPRSYRVGLTVNF